MGSTRLKYAMLYVALGIERILAVFSCILLDKYHDANILLLSFKGEINGDFLPPTWKKVCEFYGQVDYVFTGIGRLSQELIDM